MTASTPHLQHRHGLLPLWRAAFVILALSTTATAAEPGTRARYLALTARPGVPAPFAAADVVYGPADPSG